MKILSLEFDSVSNWLQQKSPREQVLVVVGVACLTLYGLWSFMLQPFGEARELSTQRVAGAQQSLMNVNALADELIRVRQQTVVQPGVENLAQVLDDSASSAGLRLSSLESAADNQSVSLRMDLVAFDNVLTWLARLEDMGQVQIESITVVPASSGQVSVTMRAQEL